MLGISLLIISVLSTILISLIGGVISYKGVKPHQHKRITLALAILGLLSVGATLWSQLLINAAHQREVSEQSRKLEEANTKLNQDSAKLAGVKADVKQIADALASKRPSNNESPNQQEITRRRQLLNTLRNEYILSHDNVSPALIAGSEQPPSQWVNQRLRSLGEKWTVADSFSERAITPEAKCATDLKQCSNEQIKSRSLQIANELEDAYNKYVEFTKRTVTPGYEHTHEAARQTIIVMDLRQYNSVASVVAQYRNEIIRRLSLKDDHVADYLYNPLSRNNLSDLGKIADDLRTLASRL